MTRTINITPTWEGITPMLLAVIENGTPEGAAEAREELMRMARIADRAVAAQTREDQGDE